jgi:hypothetical protein
VLAGVGGVVLGMVIGVVGFVMMVLLAEDLFAPDRAATHGVVDPAAAPGVGDCLGGTPGTTEVTSRDDVVPCAGRHGSEVIGTAQLPDVDRPPDEDDVDAFADEACRLAFAGYVGEDYQSSDLTFGTVVPDDAAYDDGERTVFCLLDSDGYRDGRGSARGAG